MEKTVQLEIPLVAPELPDKQDDCWPELEKVLGNQKGIIRAHIVEDREPLTLCVHYDPNLIPLGSVQRTVREIGQAFTRQYRHEQIPFAGMDVADAAFGLSDSLSDLPGMVHARVNYAAGLIDVAYDTNQLDRARIEQTVKNLGHQILKSNAVFAGASGSATALREAEAEEEAHDHGSAPAFMPHWMQERWPILLVALAGLFFITAWVGERFFELNEAVALGLYILSYAAGGYDIATHAIPGLLRGKFDTDVLMLAAAAGAAILGEWSEGAFLLFLFSLGHAGEHYALDRARNAVNALGELMPKTARVKRANTLVEEPVAGLQIGDVVVVRPGDRLPVDGQIVAGASVIDQSPITGESVPVEKQLGDEVFAGTINHEKSLEIKITRLARDNTLSRVMKMVAEAQSQQSPTQQFTQKFTARFVPIVLVLVALVAVAPPLLGWLSWSDSFYRAMLLLVAASPCALALGTPATVLAGIAQAARNGVLIKGGVHLENLGAIQVMAFDKTGTLTEGKFKVTEIAALGDVTEDELLRVAGAVEQQSNHPLAQAVVQAAEARNLQLPLADGVEIVTGKGVVSQIDGRPVQIGSLKLFRDEIYNPPDQQIVDLVEKFEAAGQTTMVINDSGRFLGVLALADTAREGVKETLQKLLALGVEKLVMLTGDNDSVARQIAAQVGVTDIKANLLPEEKLAAIKALQEKFGLVAMTGDGVNDAPALATATVGIAMGGAGTAVALETADVALMADDLSKLPFAVGLSRRSRAIIWQNLAVSLGIIALLIVTSVLGWVELSGAVVLHEGSTIIVVLNALRLLRFRY